MACAYVSNKGTFGSDLLNLVGVLPRHAQQQETEWALQPESTVLEEPVCVQGNDASLPTVLCAQHVEIHSKWRCKLRAVYVWVLCR